MRKTIVRMRRSRRNKGDWLKQLKATEGWLDVGEARLLHAAATEVMQGCIVEIGSYRGRSTIALAAGAREGVPIFAIEPHEKFSGPLGGEFGPEDRGGFYETMLRTGAYRSVRLVNLSSEVVAPGWTEPVALLWIDGDHRYEAVRRDVDAWLPHLSPDAEVIFDDARNPKLGPAKIVAELTGEGSFEMVQRTGKVVRLRRKAD